MLDETNGHMNLQLFTNFEEVDETFFKSDPFL